MTLRRMLIPFAAVAIFVAWTSMPSAQTTKSGGTAKDNSDIEMVEKLLIARRDYQFTLVSLRQHYLKVGDAERAKWAEEELRDYHRINHQAYRLDLDVPPPTLVPTMATRAEPIPNTRGIWRYSSLAPMP